MAELVDALASGASVFTDVLVQIQSRAPLQQSFTNHVRSSIGDYSH